MRILSRYVLRQHAVPFVFALSATTAIMLLNQIAKRLGDLVGKGLSWSVIAEVFGLSIPLIVALTLPMAVLVAVLYTFSRLSTDNELTALKANGISLGSLMRPLLIAAAAVGIVAFLFSDHVLPRSNHRLRSLLQDIMRKKPTFALKEQVINEVQRSRFFLRAGRIDQTTFQLLDVTIYDMEDPERSRIIYADSGYMEITSNQEDLHLRLFDGVMHEFSRFDPKIFQQMRFRRDIIKVAGVGNALNRNEHDTYKSDREMSVCEMDKVIAEARRERDQTDRLALGLQHNDLRAILGLAPVPIDTMVPLEGPTTYCRTLKRFAAFLLPPELRAQEARPSAQGPARPPIRNQFNTPGRDTLTTGKIAPPRWTDITGYTTRAKGARYREAAYRVEVHKKWAIAVASFVFVLIGVPAALRFPRGGVGLVVGLSMIVFTIYYIGLIAGESFANRLIIPPVLAMWGTDILFSAVGLFWLWQFQRQGVQRR